MTRTSDNGFILGGARWIDSTQSVDPIIYKLDSLGNEEWFLNLGSNYYDGAFIVDTLLDGNIIITTNISDSAYGYDSFFGRKYFAKLDNEGNIIWEYKYGTSYINNYVWSIDVLSDGRIVSTGSRVSFYAAVPKRVGWIFCISSDGDSLWYREYALTFEEYGENYLYDVVQANDEGFIACGYVWPAPTDANWQDTWVIKVDSIGCESPGNCWVGIEEPGIKSVEKGKLVAYPNPASTSVNFMIGEEEFQTGTQITVYDIYGRESVHEILPGNSSTWRIDVSYWPPGIYVVRVVFMNEVVGSAKFVVN